MIEKLVTYRGNLSRLVVSDDEKFVAIGRMFSSIRGARAQRAICSLRIWNFIESN